jgi:hypothetical protein
VEEPEPTDELMLGEDCIERRELDIAEFRGSLSFSDLCESEVVVADAEELDVGLNGPADDP